MLRHEDADSTSPFHPFEQMFRLCLLGCSKPTAGKGEPRPLLLSEILQGLLLKSGVAAGSAHCRIHAFTRVLRVQSQYLSMTAEAKECIGGGRESSVRPVVLLKGSFVGRGRGL